MTGKLQARAFFAPAVAAAGTAAAAALEAGAQRGTAAAALARGALPDVAPHGQHRERDDDQQYNNRGEIHLIYTKHEIHEIHKSYVTLRLFSCILCISWLT